MNWSFAESDVEEVSVLFREGGQLHQLIPSQLSTGRGCCGISSLCLIIMSLLFKNKHKTNKQQKQKNKRQTSKQRKTATKPQQTKPNGGYIYQSAKSPKSVAFFASIDRYLQKLCFMHTSCPHPPTAPPPPPTPDRPAPPNSEWTSLTPGAAFPFLW